MKYIATHDIIEINNTKLFCSGWPRWSDYIEVLDKTDPGSILDGDTLIHTDIQKYF